MSRDLAICLVASFMLCTEASVAEVPAAATAEPAPPSVQIYVTGDANAVAKTRETAEELFGRLGVTVHVVDQNQAEEWQLPAEPPLFVVHVDLSSPLQPQLVILEGSNHRELDRRELPPTNSLETSVEAVTHIAYLLVESLLERTAPRAAAPAEPAPAESARAAPVPSTAPAPSTAPPPAAAPPPSVPPVSRPATRIATQKSPPPLADSAAGLDAGVAFSVVSMGVGRVLPGGGLALETRWGAPLGGLGLFGLGTVHAASEVAYNDASAGLRPIVLRLLSTYDHSVHPHVSLMFGLGGGVDWYDIAPHSTPAEAQVTTVGSVVDPVLSGLAGIRTRLAGQTYMTAAGGIDVDLAPTRFSVVADGVQQVVLALPRVRPTLFVAASVSLSRHPRFLVPGGEG